MLKKRKGILLAGGSATRLFPITISVSKQLLPIYDKPMIYYPLSVLMLAGIRDIAIIVSPEYYKQFYSLLGDGSGYGIKLTYLIQEKPDGIAQSYLLAENFLDGSPSLLILGDNIFFGVGFSSLLKKYSSNQKSSIFGYKVSNPERYGVLTLDRNKKIKNIEEKPIKPKSNYAVTGLYFLDSNASKFAKLLKPSNRGELEITSLLNIYIKKNKLNYELMGRGYSWLDTGTTDSLLDAGNYVKTIQSRQGSLVGSPEEIALNNSWITRNFFKKKIQTIKSSEYAKYLSYILK